MIPIAEHSQYDLKIILMFTCLIVGVISLTTENGNRKDSELYNLQIYQHCTKIEYTRNFIANKQFKHCYNIKLCIDYGENS